MKQHLTSTLHAIARSPTFKLVIKPGSHAEKRMKQRGIARFEVERVLRAGSVVMVEKDPDGKERWTVAGRDADGRPIEVVIQIKPNPIVLVTVIRVG